MPVLFWIVHLDKVLITLINHTILTIIRQISIFIVNILSKKGHDLTR